VGEDKLGAGFGYPREVTEAVQSASAADDRSLPVAATVLGIALGVALRIRMFFTPITADEGGFLAIARAWANGKVLYRDVWVDRPQGLLVVFRFWDWISGGSVASVRIMAMIFGALMVVAVASVTATIAGRRTGAIAAVLVGITSASPAIEGHIANGELLSGAVAVAGLAVAVRTLARGGRPAMFYASGVIAGLALSIKQSGYEGLLTVLIWLVPAAIVGWRSWREARRIALLQLGGMLTVVAMLAAHGALTGFHRWWYAFGGYRFSSRSALKGADWARLRETARIALPIVGPLVAAGAIGVFLMVRARRTSPASAPGAAPTTTATIIPAGMQWLMPIWAVVAVIAFATGGQFHRHYWVTVCPALSALAAIGICRVFSGRSANWVTAGLMVPALISAVSILRLSRDQAPIKASDDKRLTQEERLATWFRQNRVAGDQMYLMCAGASFYANADEDPPLPYLWFDNVQKVPGALAALRALFDRPESPRFIALQQPVSACETSTQFAEQIARNYSEVAVVDGVPVLERSSGT